MKKIVLIFTMLWVVTSCSKPELKRYEIEGFTQGTTYKIVYYDVKERLSRDSIEMILADFEKSCSLYDTTSLICRLNNNETDTVDIHIAKCEELARHIYEISDGAYDITIAPLTEAYGFLRSKALETINFDSILPLVGHSKIKIENGVLKKEDSRMKINLNSIAQGYSVDLMSEYIANRGVRNYLVEIGGEVYCSGLKGDGAKWKVGIDKPIDGSDVPGNDLQIIVELTDMGMNTSGNYRKFYTRGDGKRINHIIDPRNGDASANDMLSATVVAKSTGVADGYSTMLMVLGSEKSIEMLNSKIDEIEGYIIYLKDGVVTTFSTLK